MSHTNTAEEIAAQPAVGLLAEFLASVKPELYKIESEWQRIASTDAPDFRAVSIFSPDENRLSGAIAELLNPRGTHGQGDEFLKLFLLRLPSLTTGDLSQSIIRRERRTYTIARQNRRIDILAEGRNPAWGVGIENKPWAGEQDDQLKDYTADLANRFGQNFVLVRIAGADGEPTSLDAATYKQLSNEGKFCTWRYDLEFADWLVECRKHCKSVRVGTFIHELVRYIAVEFGNQPTKAQSYMKQELLPLLDQLLSRDADQIRAVAAIIHIFPTLRQMWVAKLFDGVEQRVNKELRNGWKYSRDTENFVETDYAKFRVCHISWGDVYRICLESSQGGRRVYLGVLRESQPGPERNEKVRSELRRLGWGDHAPQPWWEGHSELPQPYNDWTLPDTISRIRTRPDELEGIIASGIVEIGKQLKDPLAELARSFMARRKAVNK